MQRRATNIVPDISHLSYEENKLRQQELGMTTLENRRIRRDVKLIRYWKVWKIFSIYTVLPACPNRVSHWGQAGVTDLSWRKTDIERIKVGFSFMLELLTCGTDYPKQLSRAQASMCLKIVVIAMRKMHREEAPYECKLPSLLTITKVSNHQGKQPPKVRLTPP